MKVTHIIAGLANRAGGPAYTVPTLATNLARYGTEVRIRCIEGPESDLAEGVDLTTHPLDIVPANQILKISTSLKNEILSDALCGRLLHTHGLWLMPNIYPSRAKMRARNTKLVHSTRGMLGGAALRISPWKKAAMWWLMQERALATADCIHATANSEYEEIRAKGLRNPVAIIPNGVDLPEGRKNCAGEQTNRSLLFFGRIHPKKGLDELLRAWVLIQDQFPSWNLKIIGPVEAGHEHFLRSLAGNLEAQRVYIGPPIYGKEKWVVYQSSDLFVLPSKNENFGMVVAEALAAEVPVISTKGTPWSEIQKNGCGWWIDYGAEALAKCMREAMTLDKTQLRSMGAKGRLWIEAEFGWDNIAKEMLKVYEWLQEGGDPPPMIKLD